LRFKTRNFSCPKPLCVSLKKDTKEQIDCKDKNGRFEGNNENMSENMRHYIDKFREFFKKQNEKNLGDFLINNGIDCIQLPLLFYDFRKDKVFIHFDKTFFYIIYFTNGEYIMKKRGDISNFNFKIIDDFGRFYLSIEGLKSMIPISRELFGENLIEVIENKIKELQKCAMS